MCTMLAPKEFIHLEGHDCGNDQIHSQAANVPTQFDKTSQPCRETACRNVGTVAADHRSSFRRCRRLQPPRNTRPGVQTFVIDTHIGTAAAARQKISAGEHPMAQRRGKPRSGNSGRTKDNCHLYSLLVAHGQHLVHVGHSRLARSLHTNFHSIHLGAEQRSASMLATTVLPAASPCNLHPQCHDGLKNLAICLELLVGSVAGGKLCLWTRRLRVGRP